MSGEGGEFYALYRSCVDPPDPPSRRPVDDHRIGMTVNRAEGKSFETGRYPLCM
jgi:hypothetical protein